MAASERFRWPAPAKVNLFLHVLGREADGYHKLQTIFQLLDYCDWLEFELRDDGQVMRKAGPEYILPELDLVVRAAKYMQSCIATKLGVDIYLDKRIPVGAGLGGGSSDAATVLVALNELWQCGLDQKALCEIGVALGADMPVFIEGHSAWAEGRGEILSPMTLPECFALVVTPRVLVPTAEIFSSQHLTRDSSPITIARFLAAEPVRNDLEAVTCDRYPLVAEVLQWLRQFAPAQMSGSGGSVFALFDSAKIAQTVSMQCPPKFDFFVARTVNQSRLQTALVQWQNQAAAVIK